MKKERLVSIIIPTYNRAYILPRAINSALKQTYKNWEMIIVDDSSEDNTKELIEKYFKKDNRIRYIKNTHKKGPAGAKNCGIDNAIGKYIAFLDSDDEWMPFHLKDSINVLEKYNISSCSSLWYVEKENKIQNFEQLFFSKELNLALKTESTPLTKGIYLFKNNRDKYFFHTKIDWYVFWTSVLVIRKDTIKKIGYFDEKLFCSEDIDFFHKLFLNEDFCFIEKYSAIWHEGDDNLYRFKKNFRIYGEESFLKEKNLVLRAELSIRGDLNEYYIAKRRINSLPKRRGDEEILELNQRIRKRHLILSKIWSKQNFLKSVCYFCKYLCFGYFGLIYNSIKREINKFIGKLGIIIKKISPKLYYKLGGINEK
jgi:glycosyltransferase involved in cell wall biosynthesis